MSNRACFTVIHVLSQLINRWIRPENLFCNEPRESSQNPIEDWGFVQWREFLNYKMQDFLMAVPNYASLLNDYKFQRKLLDEIVGHLECCKQNGAKYIVYSDPEYPEYLKSISDPPIGISIWGCEALLQFPSIAVIGSRRASLEALSEISSVVKILNELKAVIVSGGAYGCDIAAHRALLRVSQDFTSLPGVIVLAGGLGNLYPKGNLSVFKEFITRGGVILSEKLWNSEIRPYDFPIRNRIVSGLSQYVVVMEASEKSGALVTAKMALDQGRDVLVYGGGDPEAFYTRLGSKNLIDEGAFSFTNALELRGYLEAMGWSQHAESTEFV